ncbi:MAG: hypothetical protein DRH37_09485 [Deltaproteobacteria bacterium]|nr:MAG: hypothetical protein DRH37_09485 [Deltaproteobacteria bacterium]
METGHSNATCTVCIRPPGNIERLLNRRGWTSATKKATLVGRLLLYNLKIGWASRLESDPFDRLISRSAKQNPRPGMCNRGRDAPGLHILSPHPFELCG